PEDPAAKERDDDRNDRQGKHESDHEAELPVNVGAKLRQLDDYEAFLGHLADRVARSLARVAGVLDPAVRHLVGAEGRSLLDRDPTELEPLGRAERAVQARREDARL